VNISQQQRIGTPMSAANRISPQQMHQVQQARAAQQQAAQQQAQVQAHAQALAQAQALAAQAQNALPNLNGNGSAMGNPHLSPQYAPRDATSSPAHASPPHSSATPSNAANSPGPPTALLQTPQVPGNAVPRQSIQSINMGGQQYYNVGSFTQEQIHVLRAQMMQVCHNQASLLGNWC
jgi:chromatin modification-related protein VID21